MGTLSCLQIQSYQFKGWAAVSHRSFLVSSVIDIPNHQRLLSLTATLSFCSFQSIMNSKTPYDIEDNSSSSEADFFLDSAALIQRHPRRVGHLLWHAFLLLLAAGWLIPLLEAHSPCSKSNDWGRPEKTPLPSEVFGPVSKAFLPDDRYIGPSNATHHNWDHLVAAHDALYIPNGAEYGLSKGTFPPFDHPNKVGNGPPAFYVVTVLHELHCLVCCR